VQQKLKKIVSGAGLIAFAYLISRFLGLIREMAIAWKFGAERSTDIYNASFLIPDILNYMLAAGAFGIVLVPMLTRYRSETDPQTFTEEGSRIFSAILMPMAVLIFGLVILAEVFTPQLTRLLYPDFRIHPGKLERTIALTRIIIPAQIAFIIGGLINATMRARGDFRGSLGGAIYNLGIILGGVILGTWIGIAGFSYGALIGAFAGPFLLPILLARGKIRYHKEIRFNSPHFIQFLKLNIPLMIGISLLTVDEWYGRYFGARGDLPEGTITCLRYARTMMLVPIALVGQTAGQASLTYLSQILDKKKTEEFTEIFGKTIRGVLFLTCVLAGGLALIALPAVTILFKRGMFTVENTRYTAQLLQYLCIGIPAFSAQQILVNGYYARKNTLRPMIVNSFVALASIFIYWSLKNTLAGPGLALAASLSFWLMFTVTLWDYCRRYGSESGFSAGPVIITAIKGAGVTLPAFLAGCFLLFKPGVLPFSPLELKGALLYSITGGVLYIGLVIVLTRFAGGEEYAALRRLIRR